MRQYPLAVTLGLLLLPLAWPIDVMAHTPSQSMVRDGINRTPKDKQKANESSRRKALEAARRKAQQEAVHRHLVVHPPRIGEAVLVLEVAAVAVAAAEVA